MKTLKHKPHSFFQEMISCEVISPPPHKFLIKGVKLLDKQFNRMFFNLALCNFAKMYYEQSYTYYYCFSKVNSFISFRQSSPVFMYKIISLMRMTKFI